MGRNPRPSLFDFEIAAERGVDLITRKPAGRDCVAARKSVRQSGRSQFICEIEVILLNFETEK